MKIYKELDELKKLEEEIEEVKKEKEEAITTHRNLKKQQLRENKELCRKIGKRTKKWKDQNKKN